MHIKSLLGREIAFGLHRKLLRHDLPGAWRVKQWIESHDYAATATGIIRCSTNHGFMIAVDPAADKGVERAIVNEGTYEEGTLDVMRHVLKPGNRFMDIGANVGLMSLYAAKLVGPSGNVDSFEPLPEIADLLSTSATLNGFRHVHIHRLALGSKSGRHKIFRHPEVNRGSASLAWGSPSSEYTEIEVMSLDAWASKNPGNTPAMVKIDVEGWELETLRGGSKFFSSSERPVVCIEFSNAHPLEGGTHRELFLKMIDHSYLAFVLQGTKATPSALRQINLEQLPAHDNIFFFPRSQHPREFDLTVAD